FHKPPSLPLPPPHAASTSAIAELAVSWRAPCTRLTGFIVTPSTICRTPIGRCWSMDSRRRAGLYWRRWTGPAGSLRTSGEWRFMTYRRRGGSPGRGAIAKMRAFDRLTHRQGLMADTLDDLGKRLERFASEREWQRFHSPKNLASALIVEAGELLEHFQWMTEEQSRALAPERLEAVRSEVADVLLYLVQLCNVLGIDPVKAAQDKLAANAARYPVEKARGNSRKHDEL